MSSQTKEPETDTIPEEPKAKREKLDVLTKRDLNEGEPKVIVNTNTSTDIGAEVKCFSIFY